MARSCTCGTTTSRVATPRPLCRPLTGARRTSPSGCSGAWRSAPRRRRGRSTRSRGAWAGQKLAAALAKNPRGHGAAAQWLRTVCYACAPHRCLSTALTQPRLPRRCLAKWAFGALYGTSPLPLRPRCALARRCAPLSPAGQGCCRRWRELGGVKTAPHERRKTAAQRVGWMSKKLKARGY